MRRAMDAEETTTSRSRRSSRVGRAEGRGWIVFAPKRVYEESPEGVKHIQPKAKPWVRQVIVPARGWVKTHVFRRSLQEVRRTGKAEIHRLKAAVFSIDVNDHRLKAVASDSVRSAFSRLQPVIEPTGFSRWSISYRRSATCGSGL